jgi:hypothetical protein
MNRWICLLALLTACPEADDDDLGDDDDSATDDDDSATDDDDDDPGLPPTPLPFTVQLGGGSTEAVTFEQVSSCQNFSGSSDFRQQMTGGEWTLRVAVVGGYAGVGSYGTAEGAEVTLLRNTAGGEFLQASASTGASVDLVMAGDDGTSAWGEVTVSALTDNGQTGLGEVTLSPATVPVWCETVQH